MKTVACGQVLEDENWVQNPRWRGEDNIEYVVNCREITWVNSSWIKLDYGHVQWPMLVWTLLPTCSHFFNNTVGWGVLEVISASLQQTSRIRNGRCWPTHTISCCSATAIDFFDWLTGGLFHFWVVLILLKTGLSRFYVAVVSFRQAVFSSNQASIFSWLASIFVPLNLEWRPSSPLWILDVGPSFSAWPPYVPVGVPSLAPFS
jgi:hypothetical protein